MTTSAIDTLAFKDARPRHRDAPTPGWDARAPANRVWLYRSAGAMIAMAGDITDELHAFNSPKGWEGPNEMLITAARRP